MKDLSAAISNLEPHVRTDMVPYLEFQISLFPSAFKPTIPLATFATHFVVEKRNDRAVFLVELL